MLAGRGEMTALPWFLIWLGAGTPVCTLIYLRKLYPRRKVDYAYYLEWKGFPKWKTAVVKMASAAALSLVFMPNSALGVGTVLPLCVYVACSAVVESIMLIGRPHLTPMYTDARLACENCRSGRDERCTNVRMLDGFETSFKSQNGRYRPVCCCGFRLSEWRELLA